MCTVTFLPSGGKAYLVSNRDEKHLRGDAIEPTHYHFPTGKILFPKDPDAGGTWIALHENGNAIVFLNGGFEGHIPEPPYRRSRGLILLDLLSQPDPGGYVQEIDLASIEPFTAVIWQQGRLYEFVWDGRKKHFTEKDNSQPHIWSSATLYEDPVRAKRKQWFVEWLMENKDPELEDMLHFHQFTGEGDTQNDLLMNRDGQVYTVSITGLELDTDAGTMIYLDLKKNRSSIEKMEFSKLRIT